MTLETRTLPASPTAAFFSLDQNTHNNAIHATRGHRIVLFTTRPDTADLPDSWKKSGRIPDIKRRQAFFSGWILELLKKIGMLPYFDFKWWERSQKSFFQKPKDAERVDGWKMTSVFGNRNEHTCYGHTLQSII